MIPGGCVFLKRLLVVAQPRASEPAACLVLVGLTDVSMSQPKAYADVVRPPVSEILIFAVDDRRYGLSTACVQELVRAVRLVPVPHPVDGIEGVIDLHGQIVPVIDLRRSLGLEAKAPHPTEHLIIVQTEARLVAIRDDRATEVRQIEPEMVGVVIGD
jgi:chemotaxis signal transduction protein